MTDTRTSPVATSLASGRERLQAAKRGVTRRLLVEASIDVFTDLGYARTTVQDIAERAGMTRATFYKHFASKAALMPELQTWLEERWTPLYAELALVMRDLSIASLRSWLLSAFAEWEQHAGVSRARNEAAAIDPEVYDLVHFREDLQIERLAAALQEQGSPASDASIHALALIAPLNQFYFRRFLVDGEFDRECTADALARLWVNGLRGHQPR